MRPIVRFAFPASLFLALVVAPRLASAGVCGNGIVESGEVCDTGSSGTGACCASDCLSWRASNASCDASGGSCTNTVGKCTAQHVCNAQSINGRQMCFTTNRCYVGECSNGTCANQVFKADDGEACTTDSCDESTGEVTNAPQDDGTPCDTDGRACTQQYCASAHCPAPVEYVCPTTTTQLCRIDKCQEPDASHATIWCAVVVAPENTECETNHHDCKIDRCDANGGCTKHNLNADNGTACYTDNFCYPSQCNSNGTCKTDSHAPRTQGVYCNPTNNGLDATGTPVPNNELADADPCTDMQCIGSGSSIACVQTGGLAAGTACDSDTNVCTYQTCDGATAATRHCTVHCQSSAQACSACGYPGHCAVNASSGACQCNAD
jgi:hypothetical protein